MRQLHLSIHGRKIDSKSDDSTDGSKDFLVISHLSTIRNADLILVMRDGEYYRARSHDQLMEQGGFYADLYNSQFVEEEQE